MTTEQWYKEVYLPALGENTGESISNFKQQLDWFSVPNERTYFVYLVTSKNEKGEWKPDYHFYVAEEPFEDNDWRVRTIPDKRLPSIYCGRVTIADSAFPIQYPLRTNKKVLVSSRSFTELPVQQPKVHNVGVREKIITPTIAPQTDDEWPSFQSTPDSFPNDFPDFPKLDRRISQCIHLSI